jgi:hypothetical protein
VTRVLLAGLVGLLVWPELPFSQATKAESWAATSPNVCPTVNTGVTAVEKFVLQVGINDYLNVPKLQGCLADLENMRKVLTGHFSVPPDHIMTLTDRQATHEAIVSAFRSQLIGNAKEHPDALVIFQYSGHGSRVEDQNGDKVDHMDSTLVPVDSRDDEDKHFDIVDDEIRDLFDELSRYTTNVLFILDCCNSDNPTRGGVQARGIEMDTRPQPPEKVFAGSRGVGQLRGQDMVGLLPRDERYISIAATRPTELATEIHVGSRHEGALTHYLAYRLERVKPETTYRELMAQVANDVARESGAQHPQVEGDVGRPVFAGSASREDPFTRINKVTGNQILIEAGAAQGMTQGTILSIYASDARTLSGPNKRLAEAKVVKVGDLNSTAELLKAAPINLDAKAVVLSRDFGSTKTRLLLFADSPTESGPTDAKVTSEVAILLEDSKAVELVWFTRNSSVRSLPVIDAALMRGRFGSVFTCASSLAPGADGKIHRPPEDAGAGPIAPPFRICR